MKTDSIRQAVIGLFTLLSSGCVVVGGYRSDRGWFLWPAPILLFFVVVVLFLLLRRRK
jgi:hypothetical protein